jgi:hypothetical protein
VSLNVIQPIRQAWSNVVFSAMSMERIIVALLAAARLAGAPHPQRQAVGSDRDLFSGFGSSQLLDEPVPHFTNGDGHSAPRMRSM